MATVKFSFEGGSNGANVAAGAGAGTGDTNFDAITRGTNATLAYDNTHPGRGSLGLKVATGASSVTSFVAWTTTIGTQTTTYIRALCFFTANPAANVRIYNHVGSASARGSIVLNTNGKLLFQNSGSTTILTSNSVPLNSQFRLEAMFVASATVGQWEYKIWNDPRDVGAPNDTQTSAANLNNGGTTDTYRFGIGAAITNAGPYWLDDVAVSTDGYIGPENPRVLGTASFFAKKSSIDVVDKSAVSGGPTLKKMRVAGTISETTTISGGPRTKKMQVAGTVTATTAISGGVQTKKMRVAGTISETTTISGGPRTKKMRVSGNIAETTTISGGPRLKKMRVSGNISETTTISGGPRTKKMSVAVSIIAFPPSIVTANIRTHKMRIAGSVVETSTISGGVRLHKMRVSAFTAETAVISGGPAMNKMQTHVNAVRPEASEILVFTPV